MFSFKVCAVNLENRQETRAFCGLPQVFRTVDDGRLIIGVGTINAYVSVMDTIDDKTLIELEAAAFRRLLHHLRERDDVQNLDMMNLAGFCRNCLGNWVEDAAREKGVALSRQDARHYIYGMDYEAWKAKNQSGPTQKIAPPSH
jgi:uncharacterized protein